MKLIAGTLIIAMVGSSLPALADEPEQPESIAPAPTTATVAAPATVELDATPAVVTLHSVNPSRAQGAPVMSAAFGPDDNFSATGASDEDEYAEWIIAFLLLSLLGLGGTGVGSTPAQH